MDHSLGAREWISSTRGAMGGKPSRNTPASSLSICATMAGIAELP